MELTMPVRRLLAPAVIAAVLTGFAGADPALASGGGGSGGGGSVPPTPAIQLAPDSSSLVAGASDYVQIVLNPAAPAGGETLAISASNATLTVPATVPVAAGLVNAQFPYTANAVAAPTAVTVTVRTASAAASFTVTVTPAATPGPAGFNPFPRVAAGGDTVTLNPGLTTSAPAGGVTVGLHSDSPLLTLPATYFFPAGFSQPTLTAVAGHVTTPTIVHLTETLGPQTATSQVEIDPDRTLVALAVSPNPTDASQATNGGVTISVPAQGTGNFVVALQSSNPAVASVPASVDFLDGQSTTSFHITLTPVTAPTDVTITATGGGVTRSATLTVVPTPSPPFAVNQVIVAPTVVAGIGTATGTVHATTAAPAGGATIKLSTSDTKLATVPSTVVIPAGATSATFPIKVTGSGATDISIGATYNNLGTAAPLGVTEAKGGSLIPVKTTNQILPTRPVNDIHLDTLGFYSGGVASIESGSLPPGVSLISNLRPGEFVFHGSPTRAGTYTFVLKFDGNVVPYAIAYVWVITPA
jgi:trimeric autotransporter adhesin